VGATLCALPCPDPTWPVTLSILMMVEEDSAWVWQAEVLKALLVTFLMYQPGRSSPVEGEVQMRVPRVNAGRGCGEEGTHCGMPPGPLSTLPSAPISPHIPEPYLWCEGWQRYCGYRQTPGRPWKRSSWPAAPPAGGVAAARARGPSQQAVAAGGAGGSSSNSRSSATTHVLERPRPEIIGRKPSRVQPHAPVDSAILHPDPPSWRVILSHIVQHVWQLDLGKPHPAGRPRRCHRMECHACMHGGKE
jgi:hypothetical protein